jgi:DNA mismatch repair protein MutL
MPIHRLDPRTIGKIAAGEVIERPASIVKELVENALDAEARSIRVELRAGGREMIRVTDDGRGIEFDDLPLAIERHATSKLARFEDLSSLSSFGFRGEALASIAAVSDLQIVSRPPGARHGGVVRVRHGLIASPTSVAAPVGTSVTVRDLFENVPARREFLRRDATETGYAQRAVTASALTLPDVRFEMVVDSKITLATSGAGDLETTLVDVFGPVIAAQMVALEHHRRDAEPDESAPTLTVRGAIGLPSQTRGNRQHMFITVNHRWIEHRALNVAIEQAYSTLLMVGRFPVVVVDIEVPPERLDVNVHPTKREVRFSDERLIFSTLQRAVRETLLLHTAHQPVATVQFERTPLTPDTIQRRLSLAHPDRLRTGRLDAANPPATAPSSGEVLSANGEAAPHEREHHDTPTSMPVLRVLGQVSGNYIIAEGPDGMYMIDQHAAHERVLYERLLARQQSGDPDKQTLLEPLVVELSAAQVETLETCRDDLTSLGFEIEDFGADSIAVRGIPAMMRGRDIERAMHTILNEIGQGGRGDSLFDSLAISAACHSAIRAGQPLTIPEMRELVMQLEQCSSPRACGHGRPTILHMSRDELERQFERR